MYFNRRVLLERSVVDHHAWVPLQTLDCGPIGEQIAQRRAKRNSPRDCNALDVSSTNTRPIVADDHNPLHMISFGLEHDHPSASNMGGCGQATIGHDKQLGAGELAICAVDGSIDL